MTATPITTVTPTEQLAGRLFEAGLGAFELATVLLGDRLGLYAALRATPLTVPALAGAAGVDARYAREWCEQQAAAGLLTVDDPAAAPDERRFGLPPGSEPVLLDEDSPARLVPLADFAASIGKVLPALVEAFRTGDGVPYAAYGVQHAQAALNRPGFLGQLVQDWLPQVPGLDARLRSGSVAEFGCGEGWAAIALARGYPGLRVDAFDADPASIDSARAHAAAAGVADRVRFVVADVADPALAGRYDAVFAFEMLHDLAHPVAALRTARRLTTGPVLVVDERADETFSPDADPVQRFLYAASVLHCLPVGRCEPGSAATGTVLRPDVLRRYAADAGFADVTVLPIEHDMFRFYLLEGSR
ncbi:class I SAM-dependent methyltransferase [Pseudonocardia ailaonensis]|uniref:Class I SAM-dependent methyltransferase n=1 Tax=Pseudonocardia ailaonensis TaxID=367279 RepID=A0ABN2NC89_9PSEU